MLKFDNNFLLSNFCYIFVSTKTNNSIMTVFANLSNGDQVQIEVMGDMAKIMNFIGNYEGDDLGNDLILQPFVEDFKETGVVIFA